MQFDMMQAKLLMQTFGQIYTFQTSTQAVKKQNKLEKWFQK